MSTTTIAGNGSATPEPFAGPAKDTPAVMWASLRATGYTVSDLYDTLSNLDNTPVRDESGRPLRKVTANADGLTLVFEDGSK